MLHLRASAPRHSSRKTRASRNFVVAIAGAVMLATLAACGSDNSTGPRTLATITVSPANPTVAVGATQQFTAVGKDVNGNVVAFTPAWSVTSGGGTITSDGLFTAGSAPGTYTNTVSVTNGTVTATATVIVSASATNVVGDYALQTVDGKAPPDTIVHTDSVTIVFLDGTMSLHNDMSYLLLFHTATTTSGGTVADSSGSTGTYTADGTKVVIHKAGTADSVVATVSGSNLSFTDGGLDFIFAKTP